VEDASRGFEAVTEEVRRLSTRSKDAAHKTEGLVQRSVEQAMSGETLSGDIGKNLRDVVAGVSEVARLVEEIAPPVRIRSAGSRW
jgi:methyl-accepting chemotaxis protein